MRTSLLVIATLLFYTGGHTATTSDLFGLNGIGYFHYRNAPDAAGTAATKLKFFQQSGATWDRFDFWWDEIEPQRGEWKWDKADWLIDFYTRNHIHMLSILCYGAKWMKESPHTDQDIADYADYVGHVVTRYKDRVHHWEIWNEPNIPTFWKPKPDVVAYTKLLKAAYTAAHVADPTCVVVGAAANETDINWLLDIAKNGGLPFMDAVSIHPYSMADGPEEMYLARQLENVKTALRQHGRPDLPIWITEMGWKSSIGDPAAMEKASRYLVQSYVIAAAAGVEHLFWFNLQDWTENGKLEGWGLISPDAQPKTPLTAYGNLVDKLHDAQFVGYYPADTGLRGFVFRRGDTDIIVAWSPRGTSTFVRSFGVPITDLYGHAVPLFNAVPVISDSPGFIEGRTRDIRTRMDIRSQTPELPLRLDGWHQGVFYGGADKGHFGTENVGQAKMVVTARTLSQATDAMWESWPIPALPGERYTLTAEVKTEAATGENGVQILFLSGPGWGWKGGPTTPTVTGSTDWHSVEITGVVPDGADVVRVNLVSKNNTGKVLFRNVELARDERG